MADRQDTIAGWKGPIYLSTVFHLCRSLRAFATFFFRILSFDIIAPTE